MAEITRYITDLHHCAICDFISRRLQVGTIWCYLENTKDYWNLHTSHLTKLLEYTTHFGILHEHLVTWNANIVQFQEAIVHTKEPKLGTNITNTDSYKHFQSSVR